MMKAGYAGEDFPRAITPNIVGTTRSEGSDIPVICL
jgi:actin-related protein